MSACGFCTHIAVGRHDQCVVCGRDDHAGLGCWAVHFDDDTAPVCTGKCWRIYEGRKAERKAEQHLLTMLAIWGAYTEPTQAIAR